jgi:hypothetical protein
MRARLSFLLFLFALTTALPARAQDPTGAIEGVVADATSGAVAQARVVVTHLSTGLTRETHSGSDGFFRVLLLPIGSYRVAVDAPKFATVNQEPVQVTVGQTAHVNVRLEVSSVNETVTVTGGVQLVDTSSNVLGRVVTGRELEDLPLNGRNFTQLGLLQTGVAPLTFGVATAGGSLRQGHAYAVNGMRPEMNVYLVDGALNNNRVDGGFALKLPVDAVAEFRILTQSAPAEYGGTGGATTSVVTRSGANQFAGSLYEFLRNDAFDARNFFSAEVEPLNQHQFGGTIGGPVQRDRLFFFGYYEGFRNKQGLTTTAQVPTAKERQGDFSEMGRPLLNIAAGGVPFPGNQIPPQAINPVSRNVLAMYPLGNVSPSIYRETVIGRNELDQAGGRLDVNLTPRSQLFGRYFYSGGHNLNPVSVRGTDVPGFPTRDDITTHSAVISHTHILSPTLTHSLRGGYLRYEFLYDQRLNQTPPSALGFNLRSSNEPGQGPPFFNIAGYSPIGGAITGPRFSTQDTFEILDSVTWVKSNHLVKVGGEYRRTHIDLFQAIAPNSFFVFAGTFPTNNAVANLLLGAPVVFYQGLGDFTRDLSVWQGSLFAQDEWRLTPQLTLNLGLRYERINPFLEANDRLNAFIPGTQSRVRADAPPGLLFPGDQGIGRGIVDPYNAWMPRAGVVWDPTGSGTWVVRASYGLFYDQFQNGAGTGASVPISSVPWAQFNQFSGAGLNFQDPYANRQYPEPNTFIRPNTLFVFDHEAKPPYSQTWNVGVQRALFDSYLLEVRYVGAAAHRLPRNVEANPAVFGPGATPQNADQRRIYAGCPPQGGACTYSTIAMLRNITEASYNAGQVSLSRRFADGLGLNVSYWYSKTIDELSSMNLSGAAARPLAGENDLAQNPFDVGAERGPSLFDARHRIVGSVSWEPRVPDSSGATLKAILNDWQLNMIGAYTSGTPFTVSDSTNVSMQANSPPISGFVASRPNVVGDPNAGPRTVEEWLSRSAFHRLNPLTDAGEFGDAGRNIARADSYLNFDVSLVRRFRFADSLRVELRAEAFNVFNHANFGIPVADLNAANFGRILSAGPPRLLQFGAKLMF